MFFFKKKDKDQGIKSREFLKLLKERKKEIYANPDSLLKEYDDFMAFNGIYHGYDPMTFREKLKERKDLSEGILSFYKRAKLRNEKISFLWDLYASGYDKNNMVSLIFEAFEEGEEEIDLWSCGDLLYKMRKHKYLPKYIELIENPSYGTARQMIVLLVGKSKKPEVIPVLKQLLDDSDVYGHALEALTNFEGEDIETIMHQYADYKVTWVRNTAKKYLRKRGKL